MQQDSLELRWWTKRTAIVALTVLAIAAAAWVLTRAKFALIITIASLLIAVALDRPVHWMETRRLRRGLAIGVVMLALLAVMAGIVLMLVPPAVDQVRELIANAPALADNVQGSAPWQFVEKHVNVARLAGENQGKAPDIARALVNPVLTAVGSVVGGIGGLVTILLAAVFMLVSGRELIWSALANVRPERRPIYARTLNEIYASLGGYIGGLLMIVLVNATLSGAFLAIIGVPYFLPSPCSVASPA